MVSDKQVVCTAIISGEYTLKIVSIACTKLADPPNTEEPSENELVAAITGSLK